MGRRTKYCPLAPRPGSVHTYRSTPGHGEQANDYEIDPSPELSERFDDGRFVAPGMPRLMREAPRPGSGGPNDAVNLAVIGLGATTAVGGVGGRGHQLIRRLREIPSAKIVALCDADQSHLDRELKAAGDNGGKVAAYRDPRQVFDDKNVDAVIVALPNHWHALATVWACQAGKDVYVEKPFSHDLWEGQQMVAAARKYGRMVQVGTQSRSSAFLRRVFDRLHGGELGAIRFAHSLVYRARDGIGTVDAPTPPPSTVDYDLWCGPAPKGPLLRKQLHYEWHWFWDTGNGELGNNGVHDIDICRWALRQDQTPPRRHEHRRPVQAFNDCGETANTQIAALGLPAGPAHLRGPQRCRTGKDRALIGKFRDQNQGVLIDCEGGYFAGERLRPGRSSMVRGRRSGSRRGTLGAAPETSHLNAFLAGVHSRKASDPGGRSDRGHRSTTCCHMANVCHQIGKKSYPDAIRAGISRQQARWAMPSALAVANICRLNGVDLDASPATIGPWVTLDAQTGRFVGYEFADAINSHVAAHRKYRKPFVVPDLSA